MSKTKVKTPAPTNVVENGSVKRVRPLPKPAVRLTHAQKIAAANPQAVADKAPVVAKDTKAAN